MTITSIPTASNAYDFELVAVDLYRDIHKGIRAELFDITATAGNVDPSNRFDRAALAGHVIAVGNVLDSHAHHEDLAPRAGRCSSSHPTLAEQITHDHHVLEARFSAITELAQATVDATTVDQRRLTHLLYLELAGFTSAYLAHQSVEERVVMPALEKAIGVDAVLGLHMAIVSSIPPDEMARSLSFMLPAMNVDDRVEMLDGDADERPAGGVRGRDRARPFRARTGRLQLTRQPTRHRLSAGRRAATRQEHSVMNIRSARIASFRIGRSPRPIRRPPSSA